MWRDAHELAEVVAEQLGGVPASVLEWPQGEGLLVRAVLGLARKRGGGLLVIHGPGLALRREQALLEQRLRGAFADYERSPVLDVQAAELELGGAVMVQVRAGAARRKAAVTGPSQRAATPRPRPAPNPPAARPLVRSSEFRSQEDREQELLGVLRARGGELSRLELQRALGWPRSTLRKVLAVAVRDGVIERTARVARSPGQSYRVIR